METKTIKCPLCETENLDYKKLNNHTHVWTCGICPFVGLEWYDERDTENLSMYFKK